MKYLSLLIYIFFTLNLNALDIDIPSSKNVKPLFIKDYLLTDPIEVVKPLFIDAENENCSAFNDANLLKYKYLDHLGFRPSARDDFDWKDLELYRWTKKEAKKGVLKRDDLKEEFELNYAVFYLQNSEWTELELSITTGQMIEVYVDGEFIASKYSFERKGAEKNIRCKTFIDPNNHAITIKVLGSKEKNDKWSLQCEAISHNTSNQVHLIPSINPKQLMDVKHNMEGIDINSARISAAGDYYYIKLLNKNAHGETQVIYDVRESLSDHSIQIYDGNDIISMNWAPNGNKLTFLKKEGDHIWLWEHNIDLFKSYPIVKNLKEASDFMWAPNGEYLLLMNSDNGVVCNELYLVDIISHVKIPIVHNGQEIVLHDISPKGRYILFSKDSMNGDEKGQIMYQYNVKTNSLETIWNKSGVSKAKYSPNGKQLLITAGPSFFGSEGVVVDIESSPVEYNLQAYLYTLKTQKAEAISRDFKPSIVDAYWHSMNFNYIYFRVADRSYTRVYQYSIKTKHFDLLPLKIDVINDYSFAKDKPLFVYYGNAVNSPKKLYVAHLELGEIQLVEQPEERMFKHVNFGRTEDYAIKLEDGLSLEGRLYYPPDFDAEKKYPLIVYYYGGANASERNFRGRYPINNFAARGYMVYVFQPHGAIGYGQVFSGQNDDWAKNVMDEIIKGTKDLCSQHSFIDDTKIACMGAGYGGYLTTYLIAKTDIFTAAVSHAGISSVASYWEHPNNYINYNITNTNKILWDNHHLYENIALNVDQVSTPILLIQGNTDLDLPNDDVKQYYHALKEKYKEVELIDLNKDHLMDDQKRILWQKTLLAYFDMTLKNQPDWWYHLYPKK